MKTITSNARTKSEASILHLFEFDIYDLSGVFLHTLYFTDFDIFVQDGASEYTPLAITFDNLEESLSMQASTVSITIDNINKALSSEALLYEWRNNPARIKRVIFTPAIESPPDGESYTYSYGDNLVGYPKLILAEMVQDVYTTRLEFDKYLLFSGFIDQFNASEQSLSGTIATQFSQWNKPYPRRTYNQLEFNSIIPAITQTVYWGRVKSI